MKTSALALLASMITLALPAASLGAWSPSTGDWGKT